MHRIMTTALVVMSMAGLAGTAAGGPPKEGARSTPAASRGSNSGPARAQPSSGSSAPRIKVTTVKKTEAAPKAAAESQAPGSPAAGAPYSEALMPTPESLEAMKVVTKYLGRLADGQAYLAVEENYSGAGFIDSVFGADVATLPAEERRYLESLAVATMMTTLNILPLQDGMKTLNLGEPEVIRQEQDSVTIRVPRKDPLTGRPAESLFEMRRGESGWKIMDLPPIAQQCRKEYMAGKSDDVNPTDYMESLVCGVIARKFEHKADEKHAKLLEARDEARRITEENLKELEKAKAAMAAKKNK